MTEWKDIPGFEGYYQASTDGQIRSVTRTIIGLSKYGNAAPRQVVGRNIKTHARLDGKYFHVSLAKEGVVKTRTIHSLILETFVGERPTGYEALHVDGNSHNNAASNLKWGTHAENELDKIRHGGVRVGEDIHTAKLTEVQVAAIKSHHFKYGDGARIARLFGVTKETINRIKRNEIWKSVNPTLYVGSKEFAAISSQLKSS